MKVLDLNSGNWKLLINTYGAKKHKLFLALCGYVLLKYDFSRLDSSNLRYLRLPEFPDAQKLGCYLCGILSRFWGIKLDLIIGDDFYFAQSHKSYEVGRNGNKLGVEGTDNYLSIVRWVVRRRLTQ